MSYILQNMLFIHIPKTGGHSVLKVIKDNGGYSLKEFYGFGNGFPYHFPAFKLRLKLGAEVYDNFEKVSLVRNPWHRAVGLYYAHPVKGGQTASGFNKWLLAWSKARPRSRDKRIDPLCLQSWMLGPEVIRFDLKRVDKLYDWMEANLDIDPIEPPHVLSGQRMDRVPYKEIFTVKSKRLIRDAHRVDIKRHGWKF